MASQALTTQPGNAPLAPRDNSPFGQLKRQLQTREVDFHAALASKGISVKDFLGSISIAVAQNPDLLNADRASLILSALRAAQDGLHPDGREAALVIFNQRKKNDRGRWETVKAVQYMPMVYGLRKKILQARDADGKPIVSALQVGIVYRLEVEQGYFLWERGSDPEVQHRPMLEIPAEEATDDKIVAAYSIAIMSDGTRSCEVMRRFEINQVRQMSQTGAEGQTAKWDDERNGIKKGDPIPPKGPWVDWFAEMAKKTVMRRHSKTLPMSGDVIASLGDEHENQYAENALAIASGSGDAPRLIEDDSGATIDTATGEVISGGDDRRPENGAAENNAGNAAAEEEESKPRGRARPAKADQAGGKPEPEKAAADAPKAEEESREAAEPKKEKPENIGDANEVIEAQADGYLALFEKAQNVIDLDRAHREFEEGSDGWPYDIIQGVEASYRRHGRRLGRTAADAQRQHESAK